MNSVCVRIALMALAAALFAAVGAARAASPTENGRLAFVRNGCWQCHGFEGQGSVASSAGRVIADTQLSLDAFSTYVRSPTGSMPPFSAAIVSDSDLSDIYAFLQALPKPQPVKDIPLLGR
jgi:cytochrome c553